MKRKWIAVSLCVTMLLTLFTGCKNKQETTGSNIYYIDALGNGIVPELHELNGKSREKQVKEVVRLLESEPESGDYRRTIPEDVTVTDIVIDKTAVTLNFNRNYQEITGYTEVLVRAAVVKSLLQVKGIESVSFYVTDVPLQDDKGTLIGSMTEDSFIEDYGEETGSLSKTALILYFSSADGQSLVKKNVDVYYNNNVPMERVIVDNLIKGVEESDAKSVIPSGTKLLNVTVTDGVCYVNFDSSFLNVDSGIASEVILYSIVNSLTELSTVNKVQILVNGGSTMPDNGMSFKLGTSYERNTSMTMEAVQRELIIEEGQTD